MTTTSDAWRAGVDAVVNNNSLNRGGFADAIRTVLTDRFSNAEAIAWIDAVAAEFERLGIINNPTYANLRSSMLSDIVAHRELFDALGASLNALPETSVAIMSARLLDAREDRDQVNAALTRLDEIITAEPAGTVGRLVKDVQRQGKETLRAYREQLRTEIENITGDPDS